ncbi:MAG: CHC2 zinc finger domain-containing protein [Aggregatilineales bacterium]
MSFDLEHIRSRNPIEDVISEKFSLKKSGSRFIGTEHDSLVVIPQSGMYFWNSRNEHGDVFDFVGRYHLNYGSGWNNRDSAQFMEAVEHLARRAGINIERNADFRQTPAWAERQLVQRLHEALLNTLPALSYATKQRGWDMQTIRLAKIGFMPQDKRPLLDGLNLSDTWRNVIHKFPAGMLVYIHLSNGRLTYLSGRSIEGKKHYNPPRDIIGDKQPYFNHSYRAESNQLVVVEGQADAITFGERGVPSVAIAGMSISDELLTKLKKHERVFIALDNTDDANIQSQVIARELGAKAYLPKFPDGIKDANEWLSQHQATTDDASDLFNKAQNWLLAEVHRAANLEGLARQDAIRELFQHVCDLDSFTLAQFKEAMGKIGVKAGVFNEMMKLSSNDNPDNSDDFAEVFDDSIPVLSPAQGFRDDLALVTVSLLERTKKNCLNIQPYLVTSSRELKRVTDEQIISIDQKEVALRVVPEGSEFLQRWRYSDIRRFLDGETIQPGEIFNGIHDLFKRYVDFRSDIESRILSLWVVGTYFYQMFPAYPYLALNGPKNSGKSTVLRVLQPLAFNMISTSDPTGASMFRLIHYTSCTVGIDEAERYHNPRDPGMQQIRQLLNSGYKQGMPAIRITGEDMKPQAFDVYSPKILAAIMGLEDILASRCIAIPMRRTDKKMPAFPPDFDGAGIRHQLYTLALTYFKSIHGNYFQRPELHKLHNRSGELWSPLVALAAFFEEEGQVEGLLDAISEAAEWDEQLSEGKALSDREEAVLQSLEIMTLNAEGAVWLKASELREHVRDIMGISPDQMGHAQWIGHILNRLALTDRNRKKAYTGGQMYLMDRREVSDMMRRYDVSQIQTRSPEN